MNKQAGTAVSSRYAWLDIVRALAVLFVLWDHFVGETPKNLGIEFFPKKLLQTTVFGPLAITQSGGFLGVALFFLISGYIITAVAPKESLGEFAVKRFLRIFPPLIAATLTAVALRAAGVGASDPIAVRDVLLNFFLLNYFTVPQVVLVGVAWSLVIEVTFYALVAFALPLLRRTATASLLPHLLVAISVVTISISGRFGPSFMAFAVSFLYVPLLSLGCNFALVERKKMSLWNSALHAVLAWGTFLYGTHTFYPAFMSPTDSYPVSAMLAILMFAFAWLLRASLPEIKPLALVALTSYSIYLFHGVFALPFVYFVYYSDPSHNFKVALALGLLLTTVSAIAAYNLIERPSKWLATRLARQMRARRAARAARAAESQPALAKAE